MEAISAKLIQTLNSEIIPFKNSSASYQYFADKIGNARIVLLGEATHGTKEFYHVRAELSKFLIKHKNFNAIAIEGDWTSAYRVNQYLQNPSDNDAKEALKDFNRFPLWMWSNHEILDLIVWIKKFNKTAKEKVSFYGLDLYCLHSSINAVLQFLKKHDEQAAAKAKKRYECFDHVSLDPQSYGYFVESKIRKSCLEEVVAQFLDLQRIAFEKFHSEIPYSEELFYAAQNARVVKNAEHYYRALFESREVTWNIRDQHMVETLQNILSHLETILNTPPKIIVWAHNSHVGDARATEMSERKEINLGQLVREQFDVSSFLLGFSTHSGTVFAADEWGESGQIKQINPGLPGSYENLFHELNSKNFILDLHSGEHIKHLEKVSHLQRAIGVIYKPETERFSHYFLSNLPYQFDTIIHLDSTTAITPLV